MNSNRRCTAARRLLAALAACLFLLAALPALAAPPRSAEKIERIYTIHEDNHDDFRVLIDLLEKMYRHPDRDYSEELDETLDRIRANSESDLKLARAIAEHWIRVYVDPEGSYRARMYHEGEEWASELENTDLEGGPTHAFVILGYQLKNGEMAPELKGRCDAAAAAANSFPESILVCSGGETGSNNPHHHTEAGVMKEYLTEQCGIDANRIFIDEAAMTTTENVVNTFRMLREQGIRTITVVTSSYHQKWAQVLYNAEAVLYGIVYDYSIEIVENYSYDIKPPSQYSDPADFALRQLTGLLGVKKK